MSSSAMRAVFPHSFAHRSFPPDSTHLFLMLWVIQVISRYCGAEATSECRLKLPVNPLSVFIGAYQLLVVTGVLPGQRRISYPQTEGHLQERRRSNRRDFLLPWDRTPSTAGHLPDRGPPGPPPAPSENMLASCHHGDIDRLSPLPQLEQHYSRHLQCSHYALLVGVLDSC